MIVLFLIFTATFRPAQPTVGDLIAIDFQKAVVLDSSKAFEIVSQQGSHVVIRTFEPKPIALSGVSGGVRFRNLVVPVRSVLAPTDKLEPAPLRPPAGIPMPRAPLIAIGAAAAVAAASWILVLLLARLRSAGHRSPEIFIEPAERFRATVASLRADQSLPGRWASLADATRLYLSTLSPHLGVELTTSQLLPRVEAQHVAAIGRILRQGDLEKFSPWGAPPGDFDAIAARALELIPVVSAGEEQAA